MDMDGYMVSLWSCDGTLKTKKEMMLILALKCHPEGRKAAYSIPSTSPSTSTYCKTRILCGSNIVHFKGYHAPFLARVKLNCVNTYTADEENVYS